MLTHEFVTNVNNKIILDINKGVLLPVSYISNFIKKTSILGEKCTLYCVYVENRHKIFG